MDLLGIDFSPGAKTKSAQLFLYYHVRFDNQEFSTS